MTGEGQELDFWYFRNLGPTALPALERYMSEPKIAARIGDGSNYYEMLTSIRTDLLKAFQHRDTDWRAWSFRNWRLERYLDAAGIAVLPRSDNKSGDTSR
jgi:hypothetical protein